MLSDLKIMAYNVSPTATSGQGAFGLVPGQTQAPPSIWDQLNQNVPNYGAMTTSATGNIQSMLNGQVSPSTMMNMGNQAASRGVSLGQPNSPISNNIGLNLLGTTSEGLQQQGLQDYNTFSGTAGSQQQNPALMSEISQSNAVLGSAPDPSASAAYAQSLYDQYLQKMSPSGGTGTYAAPQSGNPYAGMGFASQGGGGANTSMNGFNSLMGFGQSDPYSVFNVYGGGTPGGQLYGN